jgi:hypothetical protein
MDERQDVSTETPGKQKPVPRQAAPPTSGGNVVVIQIGPQVLWGLLAVVGVIVLFVGGVFIGRSLSSNRQAVSAVAQQLPAQPQAVQSGQQFQLQPAQPGQADQSNPFQQPAQNQDQPPAGNDVPIGDNPRLAIPEIETSNYTYNFGDVKPDQKVEHQFVIKNVGTKPLLISDTKSS